MYRSILLTILLFWCFCCSAQKNTIVAPQLLSAAKSDSERCLIFRKSIKKHIGNSPDSAMAIAREGMKYFESRKYEPGIAWMMLEMGNVDAETGHFAFASAKFEVALKIFTESNQTEGIIRANNALGVVAGRRGNYVEATRYVMNALNLNKKYGDTGLFAESYLKLGVINEQNNNLEKALDYYYKAMFKFRATGNLYNIFTLYNNIGIVYAKKGELTTAVRYFEAAYYRNADSVKNVETALLSQTNLGLAYIELNQLDSAMRHMTQALQIAKEKGLMEPYARTMYGIGNIYAARESAKALAQYKLSLQLADSIGINLLKLEIVTSMADLLEKEGDYRQAYTYLKQAQQINDSMFNSSKTLELATLQSMQDIQEGTAKIAELQKKERWTTVRFYLVVVISVTLLLLLVLLWWAYRRSLRLARELGASQAGLKEANDTKDKIFSIIGHDLRGPVRTLSSLIEVYELPGTTEAEKAYIISALKSQSVSAYEILDKLLFWGLLQIKGVLYNPSVFTPAQNVGQNVKLLQCTADQKEISITTDVPAEIKVHADPSHFDFIIRNLLSNAIKFSPKKSEITITARENANKPGYASFMVKDCGTGMDKELLKRIFNTEHDSRAGTENEKGTGLGLSLCKEFVDRNGGVIWADSEPDKGTTFTFLMKSAAQAGS